MISILRTYILYYLGIVFKLRLKPRLIQLPITSKCNSRCLTCNIWKKKTHRDINPKELKRILCSSFFSQVRGVGINGGEPSLHSDFKEVVSAVLSLPKLKTIFIISNCINNNLLLSCLKQVYPMCKERDVKLFLQISIDGIGDVHDNIRGVNISFDRSIKLLQELIEYKSKYIDRFDIGCTISKYNVDYLPQIEDFFSQYDVPIYFHLAVPNKRIHNFEDDSFSVLYDKHALQMAKEFFHMKSVMSRSFLDKIRSCLTYLFLSGYTNKRLFLCSYLYQDITINEDLDVFLCATASEKVGNLKCGFPSNKIFNNIAKDTCANCDSCIHYANLPNIRGLCYYCIYKVKTAKWYLKYK